MNSQFTALSYAFWDLKFEISDLKLRYAVRRLKPEPMAALFGTNEFVPFRKTKSAELKNNSALQG